MSASENSPETRPSCHNLRSKEMFHQSFGQEDDAFSSGLYWCAKTQEAFGPDGQATGKTECCKGRSCYVG